MPYKITMSVTINDESKLEAQDYAESLRITIDRANYPFAGPVTIESVTKI